jgi:hypothetical protein
VCGVWRHEPICGGIAEWPFFGVAWCHLSVERRCSVHNSSFIWLEEGLAWSLELVLSRPTRGLINVDWHIRSEVTTIVLPLSLARMIWSENIARHGSVRLTRERLLVVDTKSTSIQSSAVIRIISKFRLARLVLSETLRCIRV